MSRRPVAARASRSARSTASLPELTRKTRDERVRQQRGEPLGVLRHHAVQEPRVRVEEPELAVRGLRHRRVRVADHRDVVDRVDVRAAVRVVEPVAPAAHELGRLVVVEPLRRGHGGVAPHPLRKRAGSRGRGRVDPDQRRGVRAEREPGGAHARVAQPRQVRCGSELDVHVRRRRTRPDRRAGRHLVAAGDLRREAGEPHGRPARPRARARPRPPRGAPTRPPSGARTGVPASANRSAPRCERGRRGEARRGPPAVASPPSARPRPASLAGATHRPRSAPR